MSTTQRSGSLNALGAYTLWGLFPVYWKLLHAFDAVELISHRVVWAFLFYWLMSIKGGARPLAWLELFRLPRARWLVSVAGILLSLNWLVYIWAVNSGFVVEASLGYFITPLFNIMMGRLILKEHLSRTRWLSVALAAAGVLWLSLQGERFPWIALALASTFSTYGLIRKRLQSDILAASTGETAVILLPALVVILNERVLKSAAHAPTLLETTMIVMSGIVTGVPLLWFAKAARLLPLSTLGFFQYIAPTIQFVLGVFVYQESFPAAKLQAFLLIWAALVVFTWESLRRGHTKAVSTQGDGANKSMSA
jgi:chloramphenicol-sensitive protein RarD